MDEVLTGRLLTFSRKFLWWIDLAAEAVISLRDRWLSPRTVTLSEDASGRFVLNALERHSSMVALPKEIRIVDGKLHDADASVLSQIATGCRIEVIFHPSRF